MGIHSCDIYVGHCSEEMCKVVCWQKKKDIEIQSGLNLGLLNAYQMVLLIQATGALALEKISHLQEKCFWSIQHMQSGC